MAGGKVIEVSMWVGSAEDIGEFDVRSALLTAVAAPVYMHTGKSSVMLLRAAEISIFWN